MAVGLGAMRLAPAAFWAMTMKEFEAAIGGAFPEMVEAPDRMALREMMARFPDS
jgi:uncharacterized phage protein (TIGR02216 family)